MTEPAKEIVIETIDPPEYVLKSGVLYEKDRLLQHLPWPKTIYRRIEDKEIELDILSRAAEDGIYGDDAIWYHPPDEFDSEGVVR